uniref:Uncharacterized protein n=1 Tax=Fagus sylvatica TaxID=28930 RepID=A0A2N9FA10_FAGSY
MHATTKSNLANINSKIRITQQEVREEEGEREAIEGRFGAPSRGEASPLKADLARRAVVRRGHPEATTKLGTAVVNGGGSRQVASLTATISSEIKAMAVAVVVEDGSGAGTTTCCGAPCAIV